MAEYLQSLKKELSCSIWCATVRGHWQHADPQRCSSCRLPARRAPSCFAADPGRRRRRRPFTLLLLLFVGPPACSLSLMEVPVARLPCCHYFCT